MATGTALLDGVVGRYGEQGGSRLGALDVGKRVRGSAKARIGARALHHDLQVGRIPALEDDLERLVVADLAGGNGARDSGALGIHTVNGLRAEAILLNCARGFFLLQTRLHLLLEGLRRLRAAPALPGPGVRSFI